MKEHHCRFLPDSSNIVSKNKVAVIASEYQYVSRSVSAYLIKGTQNALLKKKDFFDIKTKNNRLGQEKYFYLYLKFPFKFQEK